MVVHGVEGLDEISLCGPTKVAELRDGQVKEYVIEPEALGLTRCRLDDLRGGNAAECRGSARCVTGEERGYAGRGAAQQWCRPLCQWQRRGPSMRACGWQRSRSILARRSRSWRGWCG